MAPGLILFLQLLLFGASAAGLYLLLRRYERKPAVWPVPGIYCCLTVVYFLGFHFWHLLPPLPRPDISDNVLTLLEFAFWAAVFLFLLIRHWKGSSKEFIAAAIFIGMFSLWVSILLEDPVYRMNKSINGILNTIHHPITRDIWALVGIFTARPVFCLFLLAKSLLQDKHREHIYVSTLALYAAVNLGSVSGILTFLLLIYYTGA